ncbi:MAG: tetraacyldisaccharide 4'-kinase [Deltaproteobacteria bacterium]|nr:tetraacyldisaccharide 4'-kinase [Deltaproteobacteria bacterium]
MGLQKLAALPVDQQPFWFRAAASLLAALWRIISYLKNFLYDHHLLRVHRLPGHCLSVGNLVAGGTGKSPVVISLASHFYKKGLKAAILTRGYGSPLGRKDILVLKGGRLLYQQGDYSGPLPDEALMQSRELPHTPVIVSPRRYQAACFFLSCESLSPDIWLLDDGFQHRKLARNTDLVLLDYHSPFANGACLPQGMLREMPASLKRASVVLLTRSSGQVLSSDLSFWPWVPHKTPVFASQFKQSWPVSASEESMYQKDGKPLSLLSGIARPERLFDSLKKLGIEIQHSFFIADHEHFDLPSHKERVMKLSDIGHIITTAKDFHRDDVFFRSLPGKVFILPLEIHLPDAFFSCLMRRISSAID